MHINGTSVAQVIDVRLEDVDGAQLNPQGIN